MCSTPSECRLAALSAAKRGIEYLREVFLDPSVTKIVEKHLNDVSRVVDLRVEEIIIEELKRSGFEGGIVTEERGRIGSGPPYAIIDPLDGSLDFSIGIPYFVVSIGIAFGSKLKDVKAGVICPSFGHSCYSFSSDEGVLVNNRKLVRGKPEHAIIYYGEVDERSFKFLEDVYRLFGRPKIRTPGAIAFDLLHLIRGKVLAVIDIRNKLRNIDLAAAVPMYLAIGGNVNEDILNTNIDRVEIAGDMLACDDEESFNVLISARERWFGRR